MPIDTTTLLDRADVKAFFIHHQALEAIVAMFEHTRAVYNTYGANSPEYANQADSLATALGTTLGRLAFGNTMMITKDVSLGDLSLLCEEEDGFTFGMVFHSDHPKDGAAVAPGVWSLHS